MSAVPHTLRVHTWLLLGSRQRKPNPRVPLTYRTAFYQARLECCRFCMTWLHPTSILRAVRRWRGMQQRSQALAVHSSVFHLLSTPTQYALLPPSLGCCYQMDASTALAGALPPCVLTALSLEEAFPLAVLVDHYPLLDALRTGAPFQVSSMVEDGDVDAQL